ncbi:Uncharacterized protein dnm_100720 [Desulfonema magnum]|uniref:Uncharacterized protein n=1 Tax=Desulfonema magnum TaxID=45655 RepID=A0A975BZ08_9BACT|nr:Uncharacterized protein dnm_100720 [Desulfonema magnum]
MFPMTQPAAMPEPVSHICHKGTKTQSFTKFLCVFFVFSSCLCGTCGQHLAVEAEKFFLVCSEKPGACFVVMPFVSFGTWQFF